MKILVVFDDTTQAQQNLDLALSAVYSILEDKPELKSELEMRVSVLTLLPEDKASDAYLLEMEQTGQQILEAARRIVTQSGLPGVTLELLPGMEPEATWLIANRANEWGADQVYLSLYHECYRCKEQKSRRRARPFFGLFKSPAQPQTSLPEPANPPSLIAQNLINFTGCRVSVTCHGKVIMTLQKRHGRARSHSELVACELDSRPFN